MDEPLDNMETISSAWEMSEWYKIYISEKNDNS